MTWSAAGDLPAKARALVPADEFAFEDLAACKFKLGETVKADIKRSRNPGFHRFVHALGKLAVEQVPGFENLNAHEAVKRLQLESGAGCDTLVIELDGMVVPYRVAKSLSFDTMDEIEFQHVAKACAKRLATRYLQDSEDEIAAIVDEMLSGGYR